MDSSPDLLFGKIAVAAGYLAEAQVQLLLDAQASARAAGRIAPLGELAQERGMMTSQQVQRTLLVQEYTELREEGKRLGALAVKNGLATEEQIARALEEQQQEYRRAGKVPRKLGEILVAKGFLGSQQLEALLSAQGRISAQAGVPPARPKPPAANEVTASLTLEGADSAGKPIPIGAKAILGRLTTCEVVVLDVRASRQHARVQFDPSTRHHVLTDLNTPNGTLLNGERIRGNVVLKPGDRIQIGMTSIRYEAGAQTAFAGVDSGQTMVDLSDAGSQAQALVEARHDTVVMSPPQARQPTRPPTRLVNPVQARASPPKSQALEEDFLGLGMVAAAPSTPAPPPDDFLGLGLSSGAGAATVEGDLLGVGTRRHTSPELPGPPVPPWSPRHRPTRDWESPVGFAEALIGVFISPGDLFRRWGRKPNPILAWVWPVVWWGVWWAYFALQYPPGVFGITGFTAATLLVTAFLIVEGGILVFAVTCGLAIPFAGSLGFGRSFIRALGAACLSPWWPGAAALSMALDLLSSQAFAHLRRVEDFQAIGGVWMVLCLVLFVYGFVLFFFAYHRVMATETDSGEYVTDFGRYILGLVLGLLFGCVAGAIVVFVHLVVILGALAHVAR